MTRRLVWMCGGLVAVGALLQLSGVFSSDELKQASAATNRPPSTPASGISGDPVDQIEANLQPKLLKNGTLTPLPQSATLADLKAYDFALEAKNSGADDRAAVRAAAERIWAGIKAERSARSLDRKEDSKERARIRQELQRDKIRAERAIHSEGLRDRTTLPRPPKPDFGPNFIEDPEHPLPKPAKTP